MPRSRLLEDLPDVDALQGQPVRSPVCYDERVQSIQVTLSHVNAKLDDFKADVDSELAELREDVDQRFNSLEKRLCGQADDQTVLTRNVAILQARFEEVLHGLKERHNEIMHSLDTLHNRWWAIAIVAMGGLGSVVLSLLAYIWVTHGVHP